jgi:hypothetical protein
LGDLLIGTQALVDPGGLTGLGLRARDLNLYPRLVE